MTFRTSASLAVLAAALTLSACGGDEESRPRGDDPASQGAPDSAIDALAALGLAEPGRASWVDRVEEGDSYIFTDFTLATDEGVLNAEMLTLTGLAMSDQGPVFDRLSVNVGEIVYEDGEAGFQAFTVTDAGPGVGRALANLINGEGGFDSIPLEQQTFASTSLDTLRVLTSVESDGPSELVIADLSAEGFDGETLDSFTLTDLAYDATDMDGNETAIDLSGIEAVGVNAALLQASMAGEVIQDPLMGAAASGYDQYERIAVDGLRVMSGSVAVAMANFVAEIEERRSGTIVSTAAMPSLTLEPAENAGAGQGFSDALASLGYDSMEFSFASETEFDPDADRVTTIGENYLAMEDGFLMSFEQNLSGVQAYTEAMSAWLADAEARAAQGEAAPDAPPAEVLEPLMIHSARIIVEDRSLVDRALTMMAEQQGTTPAQLRSSAGMFVGIAMAAASESMPQVPRPLFVELSGALTTFLGEGGAIIVEFEPEEPVSAARFAGDEGPDLSGLVVRHEAVEPD